MRGFVDETHIEVHSGNGGSGAVSFRREKYVPRGGPDGGDGGTGGDVVFQIQSNLKTLSHIRRHQVFRARNGQPGRGKRMTGAAGAPVIITVPPGTIVRDADSGEVYRDFSEDRDGETWTLLTGGRGGQGNWHFRNAVKQAPRHAQPGVPGSSLNIILELNLIADIGFVGFPSVGKSSLLRALTNARPEVAPYPFTTKIPYLGVLRLGERDVILADIPGIIEGASEGAGLGLRFLKHISRTACLAYLIDLSDDECPATFDLLREELRRYDPPLAEKKRILVATKFDAEGAGDNLIRLRQTWPEETIMPVSAYAGTGLDELKPLLLEMAR